MARLVIVSNRVPLPSERGPRAGGLAVALADALRPGTLWFGWSGARPATAEPEARPARRGMTYATIDLTEAEYRAYYVGFANGALWPLLHFRLGLMEFSREDYAGYRAVNRRSPRRWPGCCATTIWSGCTTTICSRWPRNCAGSACATASASSCTRRSCRRRCCRTAARGRLLRAMCAFDVVGFQTQDHRRAFLDCVREILPVTRLGDGSVHARRPSCACRSSIRSASTPPASPTTAARADHSVETGRLRESLGGRTLAIGVDRLDYSKGLVKRFEAFGRLLAVSRASPAGQLPADRAAVARGVRQLSRLRRELERIAGDINGRFSELDWVPLRYMTTTVRRRLLAGFYRLARLGW